MVQESSGVEDPLRFGSASNDDMEDLTLQLERDLHTFDRRDSLDDGALDLGEDGSSTQHNQLRGNLDRFKALAGDGGVGLHVSGRDPSGRMEPFGAAYGQLGRPPSYDSSMIYEALPATALSNAHNSAGGSGAAVGGISDQPGAAAIPLGSSISAVRSPESNSGQSNSRSQPGSGGGAGSESLLVPSWATSRTPPALVIEVSDPQKREAAGLFGIKGGFVTYQVTARTQLASFGCSESRVRRRFRDFVALAELLKVRFRGYFVPPRPDKNAVEGQRMADAFVEDRRLALQRYMARLASHPALAESQELRVFLQAEGELACSSAWLSLQPPASNTTLEGATKFSKQLFGLERSVTDPHQATQPTSKSGDIMRHIKERARSLHATSLSATETELRKAKEGLEERREVMTAASRAAERLVHHMDRRALVQGELGLALFKFSKFEESDGGSLAALTGTMRSSRGLSQDLKRAAAALVRASRVSRKATGCSAIELAAIHEHLGFMPAAIKGLSAREKQLLTHETLVAEMEAKRKGVAELEVAGAKVFGGDAAKARRVTELQMDMSVLEQSLLAAHAEYEKIEAINRKELARTAEEWQADMLHMLHSFAAVQSAAHSRSLEGWLQLGEEFGASADALQAAKAGMTLLQA